MTLIDISRNLNNNLAVWPGDTTFELTRVLNRKMGDVVNLTSLSLSAHTGSHVDAALHFVDEGSAIETLELEPFWGVAQVVTVAKSAGPLVLDDFAGYDLSRAPRLLVHSPASELDPTQFPDRFVYPSPQLADHLAGLRMILYGTDAPSMDAVDSKSLDGHHALYRNKIAILEWLDLSAATDGLYELAALPLKIDGGDGSPVRAVLKSM